MISVVTGTLEAIAFKSFVLTLDYVGITGRFDILNLIGHYKQGDHSQQWNRVAACRLSYG